MRAGGGNLIIQHLKYANTVAKEGIGPYWQFCVQFARFPSGYATCQGVTAVDWACG